MGAFGPPDPRTASAGPPGRVPGRHRHRVRRATARGLRGHRRPEPAEGAELHAGALRRGRARRAGRVDGGVVVFDVLPGRGGGTTPPRTAAPPSRTGSPPGTAPRRTPCRAPSWAPGPATSARPRTDSPTGP
ncbi:hypothetical protein NKH77_30320 [Streptomyces sp. M19]